ncbi:hypothetical protein NC981_00720 [Leptolyngbya sp. DQ-M1]|uniref:hypothetical protein n=1 Tax=Leptolyngbya sp. DQ-M1 TaxID=2933920 RepID=UPI00329A57C4
MSNRDLILSLHQNIEELKRRHPDRWQMMLNSISTNPNCPFVEMSREQVPAAAATKAPKIEFSEERINEIMRQVREGY